MAKLWEFYHRAGMDTREWMSDAVRTLAEAYCYEKCADNDELRKRLLKEVMTRTYNMELPDDITNGISGESDSLSGHLDVIVESGVPVVSSKL
jgi:hypothetical protein